MNTKRKDSITKIRLWYVVMAVLLFIVEICIGAFLEGGLIRAYGGDVLVLPLLYCMIRIFYVKRDGFSIKLLPFLLFLLGVLMDVLCYALGTALIYVLICLHQAVEKKPKV